MKNIIALIILALTLSGCASFERDFAYKNTTEEFSDVVVKETCVSSTREAIGPQGAKGVFAKLSGYGRLNEPRGEINCTSEPFERTMKKSYK